MIQPKYYFVLIALAAVFFTSCKDPHEYRVDAEFTDYLNRFEKEGASRGRTFDLAGSGLIIEFATLKNNDAGLTHYETPIRIEIDKTYWNAISKTAGADMMKEDLIFHELGHGLLKREHLNSTLENDDWKSLMCGGDKVNGRSWNINYRGFRRNYYIDELFNESTLAPDSSSNQLVADTTGFVSALAYSFDSPKESAWPAGDSTNYNISLTIDGRLRFQSKLDQPCMFLGMARGSVNIQNNFSYELTFECTSSDATNQYGLAFGSRPDKAHPAVKESSEYFLIDNNQKMFMGNQTWYSFYTELYKPQIIPGGKNKLKVFKIGTMLYYFINGVYSYCSEIEAKEYGNYFGFIVPKRGLVYVDNFQICQKTGSTAVSSKVKQVQPLEFESSTIIPMKQNSIRNK
jgi:hypothetical protein